MAFRGPRGLFAAALALGGIATAPVAAVAKPATGGSQATGGTGADVRPTITDVTCLSRCGASSAARRSGVSIRHDGKLKVKGRNLSGVQAVVFLGGPGARDDTRARPDDVGRMSLDVKVPEDARSGSVALVSSSGEPSPPSGQSVLVIGSDEEDARERGSGGNDTVPDEGDSAPAQSLVWPVPRAPIYGAFGENRGSHIHAGIDISARNGTPVKAAAAGRVLFAGTEGAYGQYICIAHSAVSTCYAHLSVMVVSVGMDVARGQEIGSTGMTGNSSGPHLHFEVRAGLAMRGRPLNPSAYLPGGVPAVTGTARGLRSIPRSVFD